MAIIGYPIGNIDEYFLIDEIYKPTDFKDGWYFLPHNFPNYQFISTDINPDVEEVYQIGEKFYVEGFDPIITHVPSGTPTQSVYKSTYRQTHYPSGIPTGQYFNNYYWELFADLDNPYLFVPYFNPNTYGKIVWLEVNKPLPIYSTYLPLVEHLLKGLILPFYEKIVSDSSKFIPLKEKIISLLSCDIQMVNKHTLKLTWSGEKVPFIEVLRKEISDKEFKTILAKLPFNDKEYLFDVDNNSYIYSVRGSNDTGLSNVEITIGVSGSTNIHTELNLGDFVKIYEGDIGMVDVFEVDIFI